MLADILGKGGLRSLGFDIPVGTLTARQAVMLNKTQEELPSESDISGADDIELQEIAEKATKSTEDLISHLNAQQSQTDDLLKYPLEIVKCGFWRKLPLLPLLWCANAVDEN